MKPYKAIHEAKKCVDDLKFNYSKTKNVNEAKRINTFIDLIETFEAVLAKEYRDNTVEKLLMALLYEKIKREEFFPFSVVWLKGKLHEITETIKAPLNDQYYYLSTFLKNQELNNILSRVEQTGKFPNSKVDWELEDPIELSGKINNLTKKEDFYKRLKVVAGTFKTSIKWTKI